MPAQNFIDFQGPPISAAWLNAVDALLLSALSGTFVGTPTGFGSGAGPVTCHYRIFNSVCTLLVPIFVGVSNLNTMTLTGLPAVVQPVGLPGMEFTIGATDNGVEIGDASIQIVSGSSTIVFFKGGSTTGWTATGNKAAGAFVTYLLK